MKNDPKRATGRTTGRMIQMLGKAIEQPGVDMVFIDHEVHNIAELILYKERLADIAKKLNLDVTASVRNSGIYEGKCVYNLFVKSNWVSPYAQRTPAEEAWKKYWGEYPNNPNETLWKVFRSGFEAAQDT